MARAPASLDPAFASGPEAMEADWLVYTPLLTYVHAYGVGGTRLIPGLATDMPTITGDGTTYQLTLRSGLHYSNGDPVRAHDFAWALERAIRLGWPGSRLFLLGRIVGATAFADRRARTIAGVQTDDATGQITIRLTAADGAFDDVLALPALAPVPSSTPLRDVPASPPTGAGPYRIARAVPGRSFSLVRNPGWTRVSIPGIPYGDLDVNVTISPDPAANVRAVLGGRADVLDPDNAIPAGLLGSARSSGGYTAEPTNATYVLMLNTGSGPFSSQRVRQAVVTGLGGKAIARLASGAIVPDCYLLPPPMPGHPSAPCPYGGRPAPGNITAARALVSRSGWSGRAVSVSPAAGPLAGPLMSYCASLLDRIGFRASAASTSSPDATVALLSARLPEPAAIYEHLSGAAARDPVIAHQVRLLSTVPAGQLSAVSTLWMRLDEYAARKAYLPVLGYPIVRLLFSSRVDIGAAILQPFAGLDWSSLRVG